MLTYILTLLGYLSGEIIMYIVHHCTEFVWIIISYQRSCETDFFEAPFHLRWAGRKQFLHLKLIPARKLFPLIKVWMYQNCTREILQQVI